MLRVIISDDEELICKRISMLIHFEELDLELGT